VVKAGRSGRGYTLVAVLVGMTVMAILIAAVLPLASAEAQRDKEAELIFRGLQYAEGIRNFRKHYGRYPTTLKEMYQAHPRTLRKLWKDPMTNSDKWGLITQLAGAPVTGVTPPGTAGSATQTAPTPVPTAAPTAAPGFSDPFRPGAAPNAGDAPVGPITGVYSRSTKKGYRIFGGREHYNEWRFTEQTLLGQGSAGTAMPPSPPGPGVIRPQ
jgi:type II secretory pathway pseudopilin PulG